MITSACTWYMGLLWVVTRAVHRPSAPSDIVTTCCQICRLLPDVVIITPFILLQKLSLIVANCEIFKRHKITFRNFWLGKWFLFWLKIMTSADLGSQIAEYGEHATCSLYSTHFRSFWTGASIQTVNDKFLGYWNWQQPLSARYDVWCCAVYATILK